ncbi:MAG: alpha/beta hydrolase [Salinibacterium sp.]|nr:MAG: alpha/beta hydrolase [Salinibacterium sp.]
MASLLSRLAPIVITLRGTKRLLSSPHRTLARITQLREHPEPYEPPRSLSKKVDVSLSVIGDWPVYEIAPKGTPADNRALYLHGGCYVFEIDPLHWSLVAALATQASARITVPIMPLAPQGTASSVVPAVADLAASLIDEVGADRVSILGDSSGGGMALAVALELLERGLPPVKATILSAPWLDITCTDPMIDVIAPNDPWLAAPGLKAAGALYCAALSEDDRRVSPLFGSLVGLGPITMFSGTRDILNADARRLLPLAEAAGIAVDYHEGEGMIHNYAILPTPEGRVAQHIMVAAMTR